MSCLLLFGLKSFDDGYYLKDRCCISDLGLQYLIISIDRLSKLNERISLDIETAVMLYAASEPEPEPAEINCTRHQCQIWADYRFTVQTSFRHCQKCSCYADKRCRYTKQYTSQTEIQNINLVNSFSDNSFLSEQTSFQQLISILLVNINNIYCIR